MNEEILPAIGKNDSSFSFANSVFDRFKNPYIKHKWRSIALNSISKFSVRVLPTIIEYKEINKVYPKYLTLSLAYLLYFYKNDIPEDSAQVIEYIKNNEIYDILKNEELWQADISDMTNIVNEYYNKINDLGVEETMKWILSE